MPSLSAFEILMGLIDSLSGSCCGTVMGGEPRLEQLEDQAGCAETETEGETNIIGKKRFYVNLPLFIVGRDINLVF